MHYLEKIKGICIYLVLNDCGVRAADCKTFGAKILYFSLVTRLAHSMPVNQVNYTGKEDAERYDLFCCGDCRKKSTLFKVKKWKWDTDTYRWSKCGPKSVSFFIVHHCGLHHYICWWPLSVPLLLSFPWWLPSRSKERRQRNGASNGWFDAYVSAEQTLRIVAGGVRRWHKLPVSCQTSTDKFTERVATATTQLLLRISKGNITWNEQDVNYHGF